MKACPFNSGCYQYNHIFPIHLANEISKIINFIENGLDKFLIISYIFLKKRVIFATSSSALASRGMRRRIYIKGVTVCFGFDNVRTLQTLRIIKNNVMGAL